MKAWVWSPEPILTNWAWWHRLIIKTLGRQSQADPWCPYTSLLGLLSAIQASDRIFQEKKVEVLYEEWCQRLSSGSMCHTDIHKHAHSFPWFLLRYFVEDVSHDTRLTTATTILESPCMACLSESSWAPCGQSTAVICQKWSILNI